jgi:hypothetical protein
MGICLEQNLSRIIIKQAFINLDQTPLACLDTRFDGSGENGHVDHKNTLNAAFRSIYVS